MRTQLKQWIISTFCLDNEIRVQLNSPHNLQVPPILVRQCPRHDSAPSATRGRQTTRHLAPPPCRLNATLGRFRSRSFTRRISVALSTSDFSMLALNLPGSRFHLARFSSSFFIRRFFTRMSWQILQYSLLRLMHWSWDNFAPHVSPVRHSLGHCCFILPHFQSPQA
jgi:hypothetical protein